MVALIPDFPVSCLKGIPNLDDFITESGMVSYSLFAFSQRAEAGDEWKEESINWEDNDYSLNEILDRTSDDGSKRFKGGAARLERDKIHETANRNMGVRLKYERRATAINPFHGNILLGDDVRKRDRLMIAAYLAMNCTHIPQS
jgi:hypothetical protein